jgi:hypothetical protein
MEIKKPLPQMREAAWGYDDELKSAVVIIIDAVLKMVDHETKSHWFVKSEAYPCTICLLKDCFIRIALIAWR